MPITGPELREALKSAFKGAVVQVSALADDNDHWCVAVESREFKGLSRIEQHRKVQKALEKYDIHALQIITNPLE